MYGKFLTFAFCNLNAGEWLNVSRPNDIYKAITYSTTKKYSF